MSADLSFFHFLIEIDSQWAIIGITRNDDLTGPGGRCPAFPGVNGFVIELPRNKWFLKETEDVAEEFRYTVGNV